MRFIDYLFAQFKRILKFLPGIILMNVILAILVGFVGRGLINSDARIAESKKYKLGIVGNTEDEMLSMGKYLVETSDESTLMLEIVDFDDMDNARKALRDGDISAFVVVNDEFVNSLNALKNGVKLKYYATSGQRGITSVMMDELAEIASNLIVYSEKGILSMRDIMKNESIPAEIIDGSVNELFLLYLGAILGRTELTEFSVMGLSDGLSPASYYGASLSLFYILLLTFCSMSFFLNRKNGTFQFLAGKGFGPHKQVAAEYISFLFVNMIPTTFAIKSYGIHLMIPLIMFTAMAFLLFEVISGVINKILISFILFMGMSYVSGYFYPRSFFPTPLKEIGRFLPTGQAFDYVVQASGNEQFPLCGVLILCYTFMFLLGSVLVRGHKIRQA